jgi:excinuclease ABC subunit A
MIDERQGFIRIQGARTHNLANISLDIPRDRLVVITGLSGSGKSSLAFDTLYAEGQRRYVESLSAYARQLLGQMVKPDVDHISGLPPTLAIGQQAGRANPRSTVATLTEIHDYLRLLFARTGTPHCPACGRQIGRKSAAEIVDRVLALPAGARVMILAPLVRGSAGTHDKVLERALREGFVRLRIDGELHEARTPPPLAADARHTIEAVVDRIVMKADLRGRVTESVETALRVAAGLVVVAHAGPAAPGREDWTDEILSERYSCIDCGVSLPELAPRLFSFNSPHGACPACNGLGSLLEFDEGRIVPRPERSLDGGAIDPWRRSGPRMSGLYAERIRQFCLHFGISPATPFKSLPQRARRILLRGTNPEDEQKYGHHFEGVIPNLRRRWETTGSESLKDRLHEYMSEAECGSCHGSRLRPEALAVRVSGVSIHELSALSIDAAAGFFSRLPAAGHQGRVIGTIAGEVGRRLKFLIDVGLGYLTLARPTGTLSGGEAQRIRLATQVGGGLVGVCYVLDEPTTGLHARDTVRLIRTLRELKALGNTVLVVEHDLEAISAAEWVVDIGPAAGAGGGRVLVNGPREDLLASTESITARYLRGEARVEVPARRRASPPGRTLRIVGAAENNLRRIDVRLPLGVFCAVTGVSGSGKSTLVNQILVPALRRALAGSNERPGAHERIEGVDHVQRVIQVDQAPIGRTPRSNPATYTGVFDQVRDLYARTREAKVRGYGAARFSFNVKGGRCEACQGQGTRRIEMHFLPDLFVECDSCHGTRYSPEMLDIRYRGKTIAEVLEMRVEEGLGFFEAIGSIHQMLRALADVGLGYMALGQPSTTLSGGEAQRVRLAAELGRSAAGHTLYVLDEPTTGLHFADIHRLLDVLNRLCDQGHSILVIEHHLDVIKQADWVIDLGPEGGEAGGRIVAEGTPEAVSSVEASHTGRYLRGVLSAAGQAGGSKLVK